MQTLDLSHRFGHNYDDYMTIGINAKNSEFHTAMGLCLLLHIDAIITRRLELVAFYDQSLQPLHLQRPILQEHVVYNGAYYPVIFPSEQKMLAVQERLTQQHINPRRYFYPSLNTLPYLSAYNSCPISEDVAKRVLCLPLFYELQENDITHITEIVVNELS